MQKNQLFILYIYFLEALAEAGVEILSELRLRLRKSSVLHQKNFAGHPRVVKVNSCDYFKKCIMCIPSLDSVIEKSALETLLVGIQG